MTFPREVSLAGIDFIRAREGLRLTAYRDEPGVWTVGYGHTGADVHAGLTITEAQAVAWLEEDIETTANRAKRTLSREPSQQQFDAMCSLAFNIGAAAFAGSTVCKAFNAGDDIAAAQAFMLWRKITLGGKKVDSPGLVKRRSLEKAMFLEGTETEPVPTIAPQAAPITQSGTVQGATVATTASVIAGAAAVVNQAQDVLMQAPWVGGLAQTVVANYPKIAGALALVAVAAGIYVIFRRMHDRAKGRV